MPNRTQNTPDQSRYVKSGIVAKTQQGSADAIVSTLALTDTIPWLTPAEEFLGWKYVAILAQLVGKKREEYIALVTSANTFKPLLSRLIKSSQIHERVSASRVIAYIQANILVAS